MNELEKTERLAKMARDAAEAYGRSFDAFDGVGDNPDGSATYGATETGNQLKLRGIPLDSGTLHRLNDMVENLLDSVWMLYDERQRMGLSPLKGGRPVENVPVRAFEDTW